MSSAYFEMRPVFLGEVATVTAIVAGSGSIAGWTFTGHLYNASGQEIAAQAAATILDPTARTVSVVVLGQSTAGDCSVEVRRTDDGSDLCVVRGVLEVTDPSKR